MSQETAIPYRLTIIAKDDKHNAIEARVNDTNKTKFFVVQFSPVPVDKIIGGRKFKTVEFGADKKFFLPIGDNTEFFAWIEELLSEEANYNKLSSGNIAINNDIVRVGKIERWETEQPYEVTLKSGQKVDMTEISFFVPAEDADKADLYFARAIKSIKTWKAVKSAAPSDSAETANATA